jgi:hypothetical protein
MGVEIVVCGVNKMVPPSDFTDGLSPVEAHEGVLYITVRSTPVQDAIDNGSQEFLAGQMENCQMIQLALIKAYEEREILNRRDYDNPDVDPELMKVETPLKTCWEITRLYLKMCEEATTEAEGQGITKKTRESEIKLMCIMISTVLESVAMGGPPLPFFALFVKLVKTYVYNGGRDAASACVTMGNCPIWSECSVQPEETTAHEFEQQLKGIRKTQKWNPNSGLGRSAAKNRQTKSMMDCLREFTSPITDVRDARTQEEERTRNRPVRGPPGSWGEKNCFVNKRTVSNLGRYRTRHFDSMS